MNGFELYPSKAKLIVDFYIQKGKTSSKEIKATLIANNLHPLTTDEELWEYFENLTPGMIVSTKVMVKNWKQQNSPADHAFINFSSSKAAEEVLNLNGKLMIRDHQLKITFQKGKDKILGHIES